MSTRRGLKVPNQGKRVVVHSILPSWIAGMVTWTAVMLFKVAVPLDGCASGGRVDVQ